MKKVLLALSVIGAALAVDVRGQEFTRRRSEPDRPTAAGQLDRPATGQLDRPISMGELKPTPEMWFYEQELRRYQDPRTLVRRKAEYRAAQRHLRIESRKWYGLSNARPDASPDPLYGTFSPRWNSGNVYDPFAWSGRGRSYVVVRPSTRPTW